MGDSTAIEWADATWNPLRGTKGTWSCVKISEGCAHCYAERFNVRQGGPDYTVGADTLRLYETILTQPLRWKRPRRIFVASMTDLFEERVPDEWIGQVFGIMVATRDRHTYQILTKRAERLHGFISKYSSSGGPLHPWPLPNVWLGVSVETPRYYNRIKELQRTPAAIRFLSLEPLLAAMPDLPLDGISWIIVGGESGGPPERALVEKAQAFTLGSNYEAKGRWAWQPKAEALEWVRAIICQCKAANVPVLFKQWGGPRPKSGGRLVDGELYHEFPKI